MSNDLFLEILKTQFEKDKLSYNKLTYEEKQSLCKAAKIFSKHNHTEEGHSIGCLVFLILFIIVAVLLWPK